MKKISFFLSILVCALVCACTSDDPVLNKVEDRHDSKVSQTSGIRSVEEAIEIVSENYASVFKGNTSRAFNLNPSNVVAFGSNK